VNYPNLVILSLYPYIEYRLAPGGRSFAKNTTGDYEGLSRSGGARGAGDA
jgi:hypothetical protein